MHILIDKHTHTYSKIGATVHEISLHELVTYHLHILHTMKKGEKRGGEKKYDEETWK